METRSSPTQMRSFLRNPERDNPDHDLFELYKSNIYNINQNQLRKLDDCDEFLEEKKNSTLIFENIVDFNSNTLSVFKIIESKLAKYNIKGVIVENTDLSDKNIEINLDNYELIDFKIFTKRRFIQWV